MMDSATLEAVYFQKGSYLGLEGGFEIPLDALGLDATEEIPERLADQAVEEVWEFGCLDPHEEIPILQEPFKRGRRH